MSITFVFFPSSSPVEAPGYPPFCIGRNSPICSGSPSRKRSRRAKKEAKKVQTVSGDQNSLSSKHSVLEETDSDPSKGFQRDYVPRGPTLREQWEETGQIELEPGSRNAGVLPEVVSERMLRRLLVLGGIPFGLFIAFFVLYTVLAFRFDIHVLPSVVAYSTLGAVGLSGIGLTYGIFSASWDPDVEGSLLGWNEAAKNFIRAYDGLKTAIDKEKR